MWLNTTQLSLWSVRTQTLLRAIQTPNLIFMTSEDSWLEFDILAKIILLKSAKVQLISIYDIFQFQVNHCLVVRSKPATLELDTKFKKIVDFLTGKSDFKVLTSIFSETETNIKHVYFSKLYTDWILCLLHGRSIFYAIQIFDGKRQGRMRKR